MGGNRNKKQTMKENPFGITKEEIIELAAQKLADQMADPESLSDSVDSKINERVQKLFETLINTKVDAFLSEQMSAIISKEICPVDIFGEKTGEPTTIKAVLAKRAREFWDIKVNEEGKPGDYYSNKPRHQWMFEKIVKEQFAEAVKQNITNLVGEFKNAISDSAVKITKEHIDKLIQLRSR